MFLPTTQLWVAFAPAPAAIDWFTQSTAQRESTNWLRFVSGALLGFALSDMLLLLITAQVWLALAGLGLLGLYTLFVAAGLWRTGAWRRVLTEHFPGIELEGS